MLLGFRESDTCWVDTAAAAWSETLLTSKDKRHTPEGFQFTVAYGQIVQQAAAAVLFADSSSQQTAFFHVESRFSHNWQSLTLSCFGVSQHTHTVFFFLLLHVSCTDHGTFFLFALLCFTTLEGGSFRFHAYGTMHLRGGHFYALLLLMLKMMMVMMLSQHRPICVCRQHVCSFLARRTSPKFSRKRSSSSLERMISEPMSWKNSFLFNSQAGQ